MASTAGRDAGGVPARGKPGGRPADGLATLVGRSRELAALDGLISSALAGAGGAVLVEGSAGLGKSRLVAEIRTRARARGLRVFTAQCLESEQDFPFAGALQLFEPGLASPGAGTGLFDGAAALAEPLFSGDYSDATGGSPFPLQHGLFWLTVNATRAAPVLLCLDDAQWCDDASLGFIDYLTRRIDDLPIAVVVAARPSGSGTPRASLDALRESMTDDRLALAPLVTDEVAELVRARLPDADGAFCAACAEVSRGNPFYVGEVLRSVVTEGLEPNAAYSDRLREVGFESISRASLFRLARLGPNPIGLARWLAVLGDRTPLRRAAMLADLAPAQAAAAADALVLDELVVIDVDATLSFSHPLIAAVVLDEMSATQAALAHRRAADALAAENAPPEAIATHLLLAPGSGDRWVVQTLLLAARQARAKGVPVSAALLLGRALDEPPTLEMRATVLIELGAAQAAAGIAAGVEHLREALELCTDPADRVRAAHSLARALASSGNRRAAAETMETALGEDVDYTTDQTQALLTDYLVNATFETGLRQRAFTRMAELFPAPPLGLSASERGLLATMAMRSGQDGEPASATIELARRAWGDGALLADQGVDGPGWLMTVWALELAGDHRGAEAVALEAMQLARSIGSLDAFATASYFCGWSRSFMGRLLDAQADIEQAVGAGELGWRRYLVGTLARLASLQMWRGDLDGAAGSLALAEEHDHGSGIEVPWRLHACGLLAMAGHDAAAALGLFTQAGAWLANNLGVDYTVLTWRADAARAALLVGDRDQARDLIAHDLLLARTSAAPGHLGRALRVLGLVEGGEEGVSLLQQACVHLAEAGEALERAEALTDLGALMRRAGARAESRPYLSDALDAALRMGAIQVAARARAELSASGARRRAEHVSGAASLTPSEKRVAELVVTGLSNSQVAQALFVTPKTVEYHLRHVFQKVSITRRAQLGPALAAQSEQIIVS